MLFRSPTFFAGLTEELAKRGKPWQKNTLITLLNRLVSKGFLKARKIGRCNEYTPLVSETEYQQAQTRKLLDKIYGGNVRGLVTNLISGDMLSDDEFAELKKILEGQE